MEEEYPAGHLQGASRSNSAQAAAGPVPEAGGWALSHPGDRPGGGWLGPQPLGGPYVAGGREQACPSGSRVPCQPRNPLSCKDRAGSAVALRPLPSLLEEQARPVRAGGHQAGTGRGGGGPWGSRAVLSVSPQENEEGGRVQTPAGEPLWPLAPRLSSVIVCPCFSVSVSVCLCLSVCLSIPPSPLGIPRPELPG